MKDSERRAKIMATLGPASRSRETLRELLRAGLDVVRLNLSHGTHDEHRTLIRRVREVAEEEGRQVPVVLDLMGPRYRLGTFDGRRKLEAGSQVRLGLAGEDAELPIEEGVLEHLEPVRVRHREVHHDDVGLQLPSAVDRLVTGGEPDVYL